MKTRWKNANLFLIASATLGTKENPMAARMTKAKTISIWGMREARRTAMRMIALIEILPEIEISWAADDNDDDDDAAEGDEKDCW